MTGVKIDADGQRAAPLNRPLLPAVVTLTPSLHLTTAERCGFGLGTPCLLSLFDFFGLARPRTQATLPLVRLARPWSHPHRPTPRHVGCDDKSSTHITLCFVTMIGSSKPPAHNRQRQVSPPPTRLAFRPDFEALTVGRVRRKPASDFSRPHPAHTASHPAPPPKLAQNQHIMALNCIVDDSALIAGIRDGAKYSIQEWIALGAVNIFVPLQGTSIVFAISCSVADLSVQLWND